MATASRENNGGNGQHNNARGMSCTGATLFLIAETTSLGVLALPATAKNLGLVLCLLVIIIYMPLSIYTGTVVDQFKRRNPQIQSYADGLELVFGPAGRWIGNLMQILYLEFVMAAHLVGFSAMATMVAKGTTCRLEYKLASAGLYFLMMIPRNLSATWFFYIFSCGSILVASIVGMVGVANSPPSLEHYQVVLPASVMSIPRASEAISTIIVASMAQIAYPSIISEMDEPRDFRKALVIQQLITGTFVVVIVTVFYVYAGQDVTSPALGSAFGTTGRAAYALASPSIVVAGVIAALIAAKTFYSQFWRVWGREEVTKKNSVWAWLSWIGTNTLIIIIALTLAWGIAIFAHLFGLMGALFGTAFALIFPAFFWFEMNWVEQDPTEPLPVIVVELATDGNVCEDESAKKEVSLTQVETSGSSSINSRNPSGTSTTFTSFSPPKKFKKSVRTLTREFSMTVKKTPGGAALNIFIFGLGVVLAVLGTYGSIIGIIDANLDQTSISC